MLSKFKVKSISGESFLTHFQHNRAQSCTLVQTQPSLTEVYEAEIRRLREENHNLRTQHNSIATQLNEVVAQLQQANAERILLRERITVSKNVFYNTKKDFWQLLTWTLMSVTRSALDIVSRTAPTASLRKWLRTCTGANLCSSVARYGTRREL